MANKNINNSKDFFTISIHKYKLDGKNVDEVTVKTCKKDCLNSLIENPILVEKCKGGVKREQKTSECTEEFGKEGNTENFSERNSASIHDESFSNTENYLVNLVSSGEQKYFEKYDLNSSLNNLLNLSLGDQNKEISQEESSVILSSDEKMSSADSAAEKEDDIKRNLQKKIDSRSSKGSIIFSNDVLYNSMRSDVSNSESVVVNNEPNISLTDQNEELSQEESSVASRSDKHVPRTKFPSKEEDNVKNKFKKRTKYTSLKSSKRYSNDILGRFSKPESTVTNKESSLSLGDQNKELSEEESSVVLISDEHMSSAEFPSKEEDNIKRRLRKTVKNPKSSIISSNNILCNSVQSGISKYKEEFEELRTSPKSQVTLSNQINSAVYTKINNSLTDVEKNNLVSKSSSKSGGRLKSNIRSKCGALPKDKSNAEDSVKSRFNHTKSQSARSSVTEESVPLKESSVQSHHQQRQHLSPTDTAYEGAITECETYAEDSSETNDFITSNKNCTIEQVSRRLVFEPVEPSSKLHQETVKNTADDYNKNKRAKLEKHNLVLKQSSKSGGKLVSDIPKRRNIISKNNAEDSIKSKSYAIETRLARSSITEANDPLKESVLQNLSPIASACARPLADEINVEQSSETNYFIASNNICTTEKVKRKLKFESAEISSVFGQETVKNAIGETDGGKPAILVKDDRTSKKRKNSSANHIAKRRHTEEINLRRSERIRQKNLNIV